MLYVEIKRSYKSSLNSGLVRVCVLGDVLFFFYFSCSVLSVVVGTMVQSCVSVELPPANSC